MILSPRNSVVHHPLRLAVREYQDQSGDDGDGDEDDDGDGDDDEEEEDGNDDTSICRECYWNPRKEKCVSITGGPCPC